MVSHGSIWLTLFNCLTLKTPYFVQESGTYLTYKPRYGNFVKISKILLPWQPGSVTVKFKCYHLIPQPWKPSVCCKNLRLISCTNWVIAHFGHFASVFGPPCISPLSHNRSVAFWSTLNIQPEKYRQISPTPGVQQGHMVDFGLRMTRGVSSCCRLRAI